ncbi:LytTR family DNA-binding domain-containing protein [uncultured Psychroserpens sp.]|uniref:LytR/AlgR family response regulator transcription factor n=1 Tax=uncultured Psychroserpens sp. TaxID=255436 RepID=UPI002632ED04|nr:LytTR family DNA-binding domain-containing protein [uncultured Psychroserpens sp.]
MPLNCLIIDDENLARRRLFDLIEKRNELKILAECKTGNQAILDINTIKPELIFLDIEMKDMTGFDVLKQVNHKPLVIFVTAYKDYAIKAFEFFAFDYLLKPFNKKRFNVTVDRVVSFHNSLNNEWETSKLDDLLNHLENRYSQSLYKSYKKRLAVKSGNEIIFVNYQDITYIKASGSYIEIYSINKNYVIRSSLNKIMEEQTNDFLVRIHRSTIINIHFVDKLIYSDYAEIDVKMSDGSLYRVSKSYKKNVQKLLGI